MLLNFFIVRCFKGRYFLNIVFILIKVKYNIYFYFNIYILMFKYFKCLYNKKYINSKKLNLILIYYDEYNNFYINFVYFFLK